MLLRILAAVYPQGVEGGEETLNCGHLNIVFESETQRCPFGDSLRFNISINLLAATNLPLSELVTLSDHSVTRNSGEMARVVSRTRVAMYKPQDLEPTCLLDIGR